MIKKIVKGYLDNLAGYIFILDKILRTKCMYPDCTEKATKFPHGVPCCEKHACKPTCISWLGEPCDCGKEKKGEEL